MGHIQVFHQDQFKLLVERYVVVKKECVHDVRVLHLFMSVPKFGKFTVLHLILGIMFSDQYLNVSCFSQNDIGQPLTRKTDCLP